MKYTRHIIEGWRTYGDAAFSLLTFPILVGLLYWLTLSARRPLLADAIALEPAERPSFLDRVCEGTPHCERRSHRCWRRTSRRERLS
jgi:hypothetical protein